MTEIFKNVKYHLHNGSDSPKINEDHLDNAIDKTTVVLLTTAQTIAGIKTFSSILVLPASNPTTDNQAARKKYVDDQIGSQELIPVLNLVDTAPTARGSGASEAYVKVKEIQINDVDGNITVKFAMYHDATTDGSAQIWVNGSPVGTERTPTVAEGNWETFTENISVSKNDLVQLYVKKVANVAYIASFHLYYAKAFTATAGTVNTD